MEFIVEESFKINIYLDTNILVDYVQGTNQVLNQSLEYLAKSKFVILRSSHYVEYELVEVRKKNEFYKCENGVYPDKYTHYNPQQDNWKINGVDYDIHKESIKQIIKNDLDSIRDNLGVRFDDHVLHQDLLSPTLSICLDSKISREDSMVTVSCVFPNPNERLDFTAIFTNDKQFHTAFYDNSEQIGRILAENGLSTPKFLFAKEIQTETARKIDINQDPIQDIPSFWNHVIFSFIKIKQATNYIGHTTKPNKANLLFVDIEDKHKVLVDSSELVFIDKNLTCCCIIAKDFDYYNNNGAVSLPHSDETDTVYSIMPTMEQEILEVFQTKGHAVFYSDRSDVESPVFDFG